MRRLRRQGQAVRRSRGQALVEFALLLPIMLSIIISVINIMPAVSTRGIVLDISATAAERVGRYLPATNATAAEDRRELCNQLLDIIRSELAAELGAGAVTTAANQGCTGLSGGTLSPTSTRNPVVWVAGVNSSGTTSTSMRLLPGTGTGGSNADGSLKPVTVRVCVAYRWVPTGGIMLLVSKAPARISKQWENTWVYRFCGSDQISPNRSR